jgi:hypothetical protein
VVNQQSSEVSLTKLNAFFDKPFHGHGSGEQKKELDEQWQIQQEILRARRGHIDKSALKKKYAHGAQGDLSKLGQGGNTKQDEMYFDTYPNLPPRQHNKSSPKDKESKKIKFFWEK